MRRQDGGVRQVGWRGEADGGGEAAEGRGTTGMVTLQGAREAVVTCVLDPLTSYGI